MNILILAPHPFYQDRGTPIAVNLLLKALCERGDSVDLVTYHEGKTIDYGSNVNIYRIPNIPFVRGINPGLSWKKLVCDFFMFFTVLSLVVRRRYAVVHAVEDSVFMALVLKLLFRVPYVYDMDSCLSQQIVEKYPACAFFSPLMRVFEGVAIKNGEAVVPVCDSLSEIASKYNPKKLVTLRDVSLIQCEEETKPQCNLAEEIGMCGLVIMYVGNLELYQGIDLLLESFKLAMKEVSDAALVIVGGIASDIEKYKKKTAMLGMLNNVHFLGPKPIEGLNDYLSQADVLVSPRIKGNNTPMKIYSYLHSGKAVLATDLPTHTQVLDTSVAMLAAPAPDEFSKALICLMQDRNLRLRLGETGKKLIKEKYSYDYFKKEVNALYDWLQSTECKTKNSLVVKKDIQSN
jgi:glycosyltransferase involved in cell wall biosynthesis